MKKIQMIMLVCVCLVCATPTLSRADHAFLECLYHDVSPGELDFLFNGSARIKIFVSYDIYMRGDVSRDDMFRYWSRIYNSIDGEEELGDAVCQIKEINDPNICVFKDMVNGPKALSLRQLCD